MYWHKLQAKQRVSLQQIQDDLSNTLAANPKTYSTSATLALVVIPVHRVLFKFSMWAIVGSIYLVDISINGMP